MKQNQNWKIPNMLFRETNLVLQLIQKLLIKDETLMSWSSRKKKECFFFFFFFCSKEIMIAFVLTQCNELSIGLPHMLFRLFLKSSKAFSVSLLLSDRNGFTVCRWWCRWYVVQSLVMPLLLGLVKYFFLLFSEAIDTDFFNQY